MTEFTKRIFTAETLRKTKVKTGGRRGGRGRRGIRLSAIELC